MKFHEKAYLCMRSDVCLATESLSWKLRKANTLIVNL